MALRCILFSIILLLNFGCVFGYSEPALPVAIGGTIDLSRQSFSKNVSLNGEWEFYWNQLLEPGEKSLSEIYSYITLISEQNSQNLAVFKNNLLEIKSIANEQCKELIEFLKSIQKPK